MPADSEQLEGWKEIAAYLNRSVRTVQNWANEKGLPVSKVGGITVANRSDLDRWKREMAGPPAAAVAESAPAPQSQQKRFSTRSLIAIGAVTLLISAIGIFWWFAHRWRTPIDYKVVAATLQAFDARGDLAWEYVLPDSPPPTLYAGEERRKYGLFADLDGDGTPEFLFVHFPRGGAPSVLYCFSSSGRVLWTTEFGHALETVSGSTIPSRYLTSMMKVLKRPLANGGRIVVGSHHQYSWPEHVAVLTPAGKQVAEYWHPGWLLRMELADLDGDGHEEILLGGVNNGYSERGYGATLVVLDPERVWGQGASPPGDARQIRGVPPADEKAVVLFPEFNLPDQPDYCRVDSLIFGNEFLDVAVSDGRSFHVFYELSRHLKLAALTPDAKLMATAWPEPLTAEKAASVKESLSKIRVLKSRL